MKFSLKFVLVVSSLMLVACGQQQKLASTSEGNSQSEAPTTADLWSKVSKEGVVSEGPFKGSRAYTINSQSNTIQFEIPVFKGNTKGVTHIKNLPGATMEVINGIAGAKTARLTIPLQYFSSNAMTTQGSVNITDPTKLPNGDPLPGIPGGELPKIAVGFPVNEDVDLYIYLASKYIGIFAETKKVNPYVKLTFPIKDLMQTKVVGYLSSVPAKGNYKGGFWLSMVLPPELSRLIEDLIN